MKDYRITNGLSQDAKDQKAIRELCSDKWSQLAEDQKSIWQEKARVYNENLKPAEPEAESKEPVEQSQGTSAQAETTAEPAVKKAVRGRKPGGAKKKAAASGRTRASKRVRA